MTKVIDQFIGRYYFLSNFAPLPDEDRLTTEHLFQAEKAMWPDERWHVLNAPSPGAAKKRGRRVELRPNWEDIKDEVMRRLLVMKFSIPPMSYKLTGTGDADLIEGNTWGDKYWGVDLNTGRGYNMLGRLLMEIREELKNKED
jgi:ribA/ribD-fused uncharacterized protein